MVSSQYQLPKNCRWLGAALGFLQLLHWFGWSKGGCTGGRTPPSSSSSQLCVGRRSWNQPPAGAVPGQWTLVLGFGEWLAGGLVWWHMRRQGQDVAILDWGRSQYGLGNVRLSASSLVPQCTDWHLGSWLVWYLCPQRTHHEKVEISNTVLQ